MTRTGKRPMGRTKAILAIAAVGVSVAAVIPPASATAGSGGGGTTFTNPPRIKSVKCSRGCEDARKVNPSASSIRVKPGGTLEIGGRNLDSVETVIFLGSKADGDEARVKPQKAKAERLTVKVPVMATDGPVQLLDVAQRKSKPSPTRLRMIVTGDAATPLRARIVEVARSELGTSEKPMGSNCTKYGPCEAWCADFATWVWRQAGYPQIGRIPAVRNLVVWGQQHKTWKPGHTNNAQPGDFVIFSNMHVGLVEKASGGRITIIAGNTGGGNVARRGPAPTSAGTSMGPAPITGYVSPDLGK